MVILRTFSPSAALLPFIIRYHVLSGQQPEEAEQFDIALYDRAVLRVTRQGDWAAETSPGEWTDLPATAFSGPASKGVRLRVRGSFQLFGIVIRPSGWRALFDRPANEFADQNLPCSDVWGPEADRLREAVSQLSNEQDIFRKFEHEIQRRLERIGKSQVSAAISEFEAIVRKDCTRQVQMVAGQLGISSRQFERLSLRCFGHAPKLVLRRGRFLDMATAMCGFGDPSEEQLAELRFFDQSHRNREFRRFLGMTPQQFVQAPLPLFKASLKARFAKKNSISDI